MNDKTNNEQSPFYVEYTGKTKNKKTKQNTKTYGYHVKDDFEKPLKEFFDIRFGSDASDNEIMEKIVQYYYFSFAHSRSYYQKTIVAIMHKDEIKKSNPQIMPMFIDDRYAHCDNGDLDMDDETKRMVTFQFHAYTRLFKDIDVGLKDRIFKQFFEDGYSLHKQKIFTMFGDSDFNEDSFNNFIVLEIALNNYLDVLQNGVYGFLQDNGTLKENQHCGIVVANSNYEISDFDSFPITFNWRLNSDFTIDLLDIVKLSEKNLSKLISDYNLGLVMVLNPILNSNVSLQNKLKKNQETIDDLESMLESMKDERLKILDAIEKFNSLKMNRTIDLYSSDDDESDD